MTSCITCVERSALGVPVVHVRRVLRRGGIDDVKGAPSAWRFVFPLHVGPIPNADETSVTNSVQRLPSIACANNDLIVGTKKRLSAFYPTDLDFLLRNLGTRRVVLDGCMADCWILNSAFEASNLGYRVIVLRDLVRGTDPDMEEAALKMISLHIGLVADSADLVAE